MTAPISMAQVIQMGASRRELPKPCPFCGSNPPLARRAGINHIIYIVGCESDDCWATPEVHGATVEEAWSRWNARAK